MALHVSRLTSTVLAMAAGVACAGDGTGVDNGNGNGGVVTLSGDVQPILSQNCTMAGCHSGTSPAQGQNLSTGQTWANTVNVPANESALMRILPGKPDLSYLVHKIEGTQAVSGSGGRMPLGRSPLSQGDIDKIREWIQAGALNN